jgi:hypothetical protein
MDWRRGFFRLWVIGSALFVIAVAAINYSEIKAQFDAALPAGFVLDLPVPCGEASRGVEGTDFHRGVVFDDQIPPAKRVTPAKPPNASDTCYYELAKFRLLYPEYLSDKVLTSKLFARHGVTLRDPWTTLLTVVQIAFGIPLIVLIFGAVLSWALSGFKKPSAPRA